jgi:hypothetical protein
MQDCVSLTLCVTVVIVDGDSEMLRNLLKVRQLARGEEGPTSVGWTQVLLGTVYTFVSSSEVIEPGFLPEASTEWMMNKGMNV